MSSVSSLQRVSPSIPAVPLSSGAPQFTPLEEAEVRSNEAAFLFPPLSGAFPVGVQSYVLQDVERSIGISVHYPSERGLSVRRHPLQFFVEDLRMTQPHVETARFANCCSHAQPHVLPREGSFPVVLMAHGLGMRPDDYQPLVEELASHGFCVITVESPGVAGYSRALESQGKPAMLMDEEIPTADRAVQLQIQDIEFVLKTLPNFAKAHPQLAGTMDLQRVGVMGHSLGGAAAAQICRNHADVRAGINLDGRLLGENATGPICQPFVTIQCDRPGTVLEVLLPDVKASLADLQEAKQLRDSGGDAESANEQESKAIARLEAAATGAENFLDPMEEFDAFHARAGAGSYQVALLGSRHGGFCAADVLGHHVGLDWAKQRPTDVSTWAAANRHIVSFFSETLKGIPSRVVSGSKIEESVLNL